MVWSLNVAIYRTRDMSLIKKIGTHPDIYPHIIDDGCPSNPADWQPHDNGRNYFLIPSFLSSTENIPMGIIAFYAINHVLFDAHICILPEFRKKMTADIGLKATQWMFDNTSCKKIIAFIPVNRPDVLALAQKGSLKLEGFCKNSFLSDGILIDQYIYGLGRE